MTKDGHGFNWGAFFFGPFFLGGHRCYGMMCLSLLLLIIPIINFVWLFICGVKGSEWAAENCGLNDSEFKVSMTTWNRGGIVCLVLIAIPTILGIILAVAIPGMVLQSIKSNDSVDQNTLQKLLNNPAIQKMLDSNDYK